MLLNYLLFKDNKAFRICFYPNPAISAESGFYLYTFPFFFSCFFHNFVTSPQSYTGRTSDYPEIFIVVGADVSSSFMIDVS